jgi:hypothetical protein
MKFMRGLMAVRPAGTRSRSHPNATIHGPNMAEGDLLSRKRSEVVYMCSKCAQRTSERAGGDAGKGMRYAICGMGARDRSGEAERESERAREQRRQGGQGLAADKEPQRAMAVSEAKHLTDRPE